MRQNPKKSLMTVVYHGTATIDDGIQAGWETNFDARSINTQKKEIDIVGMVDKNVVLKLPGRIHQGFAKKYLSTKPMMLGLIREYISKMDKQQKNNLQIIFTGHSQAGAVGNIALHDIAVNHGEELFGPKFDNRLHSRLYGYFLSAPRTGDAKYVKSLHEKVGQKYILRQNVHGDPVPVILGNKFLGKTIGKISSFVRDISRYEDSGYLLLEKGSNVWGRLNINDIRRGRRAHTKQALVGSIIDELSAIKYSVNSFKLVAEIKNEVKKSKGLWKVFRFFKAITKGVGKRMGKILLPIPKAISSIIGDYAITQFAHYHYGYDARDGRGAVFAPQLVGRDLEYLLSYGQIRAN